MALVNKVKPKPPSQQQIKRRSSNIQQKENQENNYQKIVQEQDDGQLIQNTKSGQIGRLNKLKSFGEINQPEQSSLQRITQPVVERGRNKSPSQQIVNKVVLGKQEQQENEMKKKQSQDIRLKQRQQELKEQLERIKVEKREQELRQKEEERNKRLEQEEQERKKQEKFKKEQELKKQKLKEHQMKLDEEKRQKEQSALEQKKEQEMQKKKEVDEFMKKQKQKLKEEFLEKGQLKQKEKEEKEREKDLEKQKEEMRKKKAELTIEQEKEKREKEKNLKRHYEELEKDLHIQDIFNKYEKILRPVFTHFKEYMDFKFDKNYDKDNLTFKGYTQFCSQFNITNTVIPSDEVQQIFKILIKDKNISDSSLNYQNFQSVLLRLGIQGRKFFDSFASKVSQEQKSITEITQMVLDEKKKDENKKSVVNQQQGGSISQLEDFDDTLIISSINGLMKYLHLPSEKQELAALLRAMKNEAGKIQAKQPNQKNENEGDDTQQKSISEIPRGRQMSVVKSIKEKNFSKNRDTSKTNDNNQNNNQPKRKISENRDRSKSKNTDRSRSDSLKATDVLKLKPAEKSKLSNIIAPDGKKEGWKTSK